MQMKTQKQQWEKTESFHYQKEINSIYSLVFNLLLDSANVAMQPGETAGSAFHSAAAC